MDMKKALLTTASAVFLGGCAYSQFDQSVDRGYAQVHRKDASISIFSANAAGGLPDRWLPLVVHRTKRRTQYQLVAEQGRTILHARAVNASSALMQHVNIDPLTQPWLSWTWRISGLIKSADNFQTDTEDSPARIILGFDGDKESLPFSDQVLFETAKALTGHEFPYATLMYIWENKAAIGTVIPHARSDRIKMIVAASGSDGIGRWQDFTRNIAEDYEKAFGEKPGPLIGVGVLTDTDNTGETVDAWYGDIRLTNERRIASSSN